MNMKRLSYLWICLLVILFAIAAASCGGGGGGGGSTPTPTPTATATVDPTFTMTDFAGTWTYAAGAFTGTMTFNSAGTAVNVTVNECGTTHYNVMNYVDNSGTYGYNMFIRVYGFCNQPTYLMKFALNSSADKQSGTGIADLHYNGDGSAYTRYSCTMVKESD